VLRLGFPLFLLPIVAKRVVVMMSIRKKVAGGHQRYLSAKLRSREDSKKPEKTEFFVRASDS
jgi:hypothetical protein